MEEVPKRGTNWVAVLAIVISLLIVLAGIATFAPNLPARLVNDTNSLLGRITTNLPQSTSSTSSSNQTALSYVVYSPTINGSGSNITFPPTYATLANYSLSLINQDRAKFGLSPVTLSPIKSGQQHADSMLYFRYFSHIDTQGYKPYMRYSLLGGRGSMAENIAFEAWSGPHYFSVRDVEGTISTLESQMMYNDSICCNNGHRDNILTGMHNRVSIGVAYDTTHVYFVEDFETYYIDLNFSVNPNYVVQFTGTPLRDAQVMDIGVFYDPTPSPESVAQLNAGGHEYDSGTAVGGVLPPCTVSCKYFPGAVTVYATTWKYSATQVDVAFPMIDFIQKDGAGVYTLYMMTGSSTNSSITTISVFVNV
ncbi:MAG: CAP domain-containing protein [Thaumarchaeota archaeon]|nr:CAP domain-containing protein [Nitrososphaerota archaeon]